MHLLTLPLSHFPRETEQICLLSFMAWPKMNRCRLVCLLISGQATKESGCFCSLSLPPTTQWEEEEEGEKHREKQMCPLSSAAQPEMAIFSPTLHLSPPFRACGDEGKQAEAGVMHKMAMA